MRNILAAFALIIAATEAFAANRPSLAVAQSIDNFADSAMERWEVPGLAVAVLHDGEVIYRLVSGFRDVEYKLPVTTRTLFAVGSISKSFTVAGLARLARAGKLDWDAPVTTYLPELVLTPAPSGRPVSTRDLITHRSGMHRHDALWYLHAHSRDGLLRRLRHLPRFAPAGAIFQYSNLMIMAAGRIAGRISGRSWETLTREDILDPLGMTQTRLGLAGFLAAPDRSSGYYPSPVGRIKIPPQDTDAIGPAAAIYANIEDMARWLRFLQNADYMATARIDINQPSRHAELGPKAYGMGLYVGSYRGNKLARHPGVIDGYSALISFMPAQKLGIIVLTNKSGGNPAPTAISYATYDRILRLEPIDWLRRYRSSKDRRHKHTDAPNSPATKRPPPPLPKSAYHGAFEHPAYGRLKIDQAEDSTLTGQFHGLTFVLNHAGGNRWRLPESHWPLRQGLIFRFIPDSGGIITRLATPLADGPTYRHNPGELFFDRVTDSP